MVRLPPPEPRAVLEPLAQPQLLTHEGFQIIDPLKAALDEANKRGAKEDLRIKAQAKLDYWVEARVRRDKAIKEMDASLKPPPVTVDQPKVEECLVEATEAKVDPVLLAAAHKKLEVARLSQRVYEKSKEVPGKLDIPLLQEELEDVGGEQLGVQQKLMREMEGKVKDLTEKIEDIKETMARQKARDDLLKKQVKKPGNKKQKPEDKNAMPLTPAWVREGDAAGGEIIEHEVADPVAEQQARDLKRLEAELKVANEELKGQQAIVKGMVEEVYVPQDIITFSQTKLKASMNTDAMQQLQLPELLDLDCAALDAAIKACEVKYGELEIKGLDELICDVPKEEIDKAKVRLRDARRAQERQARARNQLTVRINAPTGTATFDMLVKLVAEAKQAGVEDELILRAELKLKKMEELAASTLRAGPLAFISYHFPCLRPCVSSYAISLVEKAEEKRRADFDNAEAAKAALMLEIGDWQRGVMNKHLKTVDEAKLQAVTAAAVAAGLPQEVIELGRLKLGAVQRYKSDLAKGLIKDEDEEAKKAAAAKKAGGGGGKKNKKQYAYQKPG